MKQCEQNVGDFRDCLIRIGIDHLPPLEFGTYFYLLDRYWGNKNHLPKDKNLIFEDLRAFNKEKREAVESVLEEFFIETEAGFYHKCCEEEIAEARKKSDKGAI